MEEYNYFGRGREENDSSEYQPIFFKKLKKKKILISNY